VLEKAEAGEKPGLVERSPEEGSKEQGKNARWEERRIKPRTVSEKG
jgi:hypothetical protein